MLAQYRQCYQYASRLLEPYTTAGLQLLTAGQRCWQHTLSEAPQGDTKPLNLCNAVNDALHIALDSNDKALVFGEDIAFGGVFRCTVGLLERYGRSRVFNTPLAEQVAVLQSNWKASGRA
eukprot:GHRR01010075.1.p1 GENE.GHRR01010075.1~~GHRR01010075.1.p1  ORF type:complete len:120 (+),score=30.50 GHRR01010075.1:246-605(+)